MKIIAISDIHGEFRKPAEMAGIARTLWEAQPDVLVLAGDIHTGAQGVRWAGEAFAYADFPIIMVNGNHEYYSRKVNTLDGKIREEAAKFPFIHFLQNESVEIAGVTFSGTTLWTDGTAGETGQNEILTEREKMGSGMNDYKKIRIATPKNYRKMRPADTFPIHERAVRFLDETAGKPTGPWVVVSHHAPSMKALANHPGIEETGYPRAAYASPLDEKITGWKPTAWIHGHIHEPGSYEIAGTTVHNVAMGYPGEEKSEFTTIHISP